MHICVVGMDESVAMNLRKGQPDALGNRPEVQLPGGGPCRVCLNPIEPEESMLVLAHRPFSTKHPYAECGPVFIHERQCVPYDNDARLPDYITRHSGTELIARAYGDDERIIYDLARVVRSKDLETALKEFLCDDRAAFVDVRLGPTNCFQFRVTCR